MDIGTMIVNSDGRRKRWDDKHRSGGHAPGGAAAFLLEVAPDLPAPPALALDVACGSGANATYLAKSGYTVEAMDWSVSALSRLDAAKVRPIACDVTRFPLPESRYAVVACFRFLERGLWAAMARALLPGGALVVETFTTRHLERHPEFPRAYCLEPGELRRAFETDFRVAVYEESETARLLAFRGPGPPRARVV